jgi:GNAT superfamily N-acetyltransferase
MKSIILRPAGPERDFERLAAWFSVLEGEPNSESDVREYFDRERARTIQRVAEDEQGQMLGFYWMVRHRSVAGRAFLYLFVSPERRGDGVGRRLYEDVVRGAQAAQAIILRVNIPDDLPEGRTFAEHRGFVERLQRIILELDLDAFDDRPYDAIIARLRREGFRFASMEELGDTEDAQPQAVCPE